MAAAPTPSPHLSRLARAYVEPGDHGALDMLVNGQQLREALGAYEDECVRVARNRRATWAEIGDAVGMARQNAERKYRHVEHARKEAQDD